MRDSPHAPYTDEEQLLDARIDLTTAVAFPAEGWQERYCEAVDRIAKHYGVPRDDLVRAYMEHMGPSFVVAVAEGKRKE